MIVLFVFMYIFGFNIYGPIDSTILTGLIISLYFLFNSKCLNDFVNQIFSKKVLIFILLSILLMLWSVITSVINQAYDFSYIKTYIHFIIVIFIGIELLVYISHKGKTDKIVNYIIICFCIQSVFQMMCYAFPVISKFFDYFRSESMIEIGLTYNGFRGIALTKSGFFSLSSAYAVSFVLFFSKYNTITKKVFGKSIILLLLVVGTFFAGRTGFVGLIYAVMMKIAFSFSRKKINFSIINTGKIIVIFFLAIFLLFSLSKNDKIEKLYSYVFEAFYNLFEGEGFNTASSNILIEMYDVDLSMDTIIVGDGKYYDTIGNKKIYYQQTDVGYLRKILYFGLVGLFLSIIIQINLLGKKLSKQEKITLFILLLILELKGEILSFNIMVGSVVLLYSNYSLKKEENLKCLI